MSDPDTPVPAPRRSGIGVLGAFLIIIIAVVLSVFAIGGLFVALGFPADAAQQLTNGRAVQATIQAQNTQLQLQNAALETTVANLDKRVGTSREEIDDLTRQLAEMNALRGQIQQIDQRSATVFAQAQTSQDSVNTFATVEANRAALLSELDRRSARVERFLERLSDISGDASSDLSGGQQTTPTSTATPTVLPSPSATITPSPTSTEETTPTLN